MSQKIVNYGCDLNGSGNCSGEHSEIRILPTSKDPLGSNDLVCHKHYLVEMEYRRERNRELETQNQFTFPAWESLEVYNPE